MADRRMSTARSARRLAAGVAAVVLGHVLVTPSTAQAAEGPVIEQSAFATPPPASAGSPEAISRGRGAPGTRAEIGGPFPTLAGLAGSRSLGEQRERAQKQKARREAAVRRSARRLEADRRVALAAMWQPDASLLAPRKTDSAQTATVRGRLSALVDRLQGAGAAYESALYAADRSRVAARKARGVAKSAAAAADIARAKWAEDRAALGAIAADAYQNGSVGQIGLVLGAGSAEDSEALFSGLTLLTQVSSTQGDATTRAAASAAALKVAEQKKVRAVARAQRAADRKAVRLQAKERTRRTVVKDVRKAQTLIRESILIDEIAASVDTDALTETSARTAAELEGGVVFPLPPDSGWRDNDNWGDRSGHWKKNHTGVDFSVGCGTPVYAAHKGVVNIRTDQGWSGKWLVVVQTKQGGLSTWYAHMSGLRTRHLKEVEAGELIGFVGSLGNSTGCHLHFEVHPLGGTIYEDNVDPVAWLTIARGYPTTK